MTLAVSSLALSGCAHHRSDTFLDAFEANLAANSSATEALRQWCAAQGIADAAQITARFVRGADAAAPDGLRATLQVGPDEVLGYRHVQLVCGEVVLSQAHNWFVPSRLGPEMNRQLNETDVPFGKVAAALRFSRQPIASARRGDPACPAGAISTHRALLCLPNGDPLALVVECYTEANLGV
jgi:hypothetical protein